jgi:hypothetical protein
MPPQNEGLNFPELLQWPAYREMVKWYHSLLVPFDYEEDSIQKRILGAAHSCSEKRVLHQRLELAKKSASSALFGIAFRFFFGKATLLNFSDMEQEFFIKVYLSNSDTPLPKNQNWFTTEFLQRLRKEERNWKERKESLRLAGGPLTEIARNWTNPHFPMWMMNNVADAQAMRLIVV